MWRRTQVAGCEGQIDDVGRDSVIMGELSCVVSVNVTVSFISSSNIRRLRYEKRHEKVEGKMHSEEARDEAWNGGEGVEVEEEHDDLGPRELCPIHVCC